MRWMPPAPLWTAVGAGAVAAAVVLQVSTTAQAALSSTEIARRAAQITVLITVEGETGPGRRYGSGTLLSREGSTYYLLTANHVLDGQQNYQVRTADGQTHRLSSIRPLPGVDLAIAQFSSNGTYPTAQIGQGSPILPGMDVYVAGYPVPSDVLPANTFNITDGKVTAAPSAGATAENLGYTVLYNNLTRAGMSGGPVLDNEGQVIAIHGRTEGGTEVGKGLNAGIPISTFLALVPKVYEEQGTERLIAGDYDGAIAAFRQGLRFNQTSADVLSSLAYAYFAKGDYRQAIEMASQSLQNDPRSINALRVRGAAYIQSNNFGRAVEDLNQAVSGRGRAIDYGLRGLAQMRSSRFQEANQDATRAVESATDSPVSYLLSSSIRSQAGDSRGAQEDRNRATQLLATAQPNAYELAIARGLRLPLDGNTLRDEGNQGGRVSPPGDNGVQGPTGNPNPPGTGNTPNPPPPPAGGTRITAAVPMTPAAQAIARALENQRRHRFGNRGFNPQILPTGVPGYDFSIRTTTRSVYYYAKPERSGPASYVGAIFLDQNSETNAPRVGFASVLCGDPRGIRPADPVYVRGSVRCGGESLPVGNSAANNPSRSPGPTGNTPPPPGGNAGNSTRTANPATRPAPPTVAASSPAVATLMQMIRIQQSARSSSQEFIRFPGQMTRPPYNLSLASRYDYSIRTTTRGAFHYAIPDSGSDRASVAAIFLAANAPTNARNPNMVWVACQAITPGRVRPADPSYGAGGLRCGPGTEPVDMGQR